MELDLRVLDSDTVLKPDPVVATQTDIPLKGRGCLSESRMSQTICCPSCLSECLSEQTSPILWRGNQQLSRVASGLGRGEPVAGIGPSRLVYGVVDDPAFAHERLEQWFQVGRV